MKGQDAGSAGRSDGAGQAEEIARLSERIDQLFDLVQKTAENATRVRLLMAGSREETARIEARLEEIEKALARIEARS